MQGDKRDNVVYANRWLTRDQYIEMARQEILARGLELPAAEATEQPAAAEAPGPDAGATAATAPGKPDAATAATPE